MPPDQPMAGQIVELLVERGQTLAVAESLTGGLVAAEITAVPGASQAFRGSLTCYATALKRDVLGVSETLLEERGAVDSEVSRQMARGACSFLDADWGVATTGVAGPEPQDGQPVGTVYTAAAGPGGTVTAVRLRLEGGRSEIRAASVRAALQLLRDELIGHVRGQDREQTGGNGCLQP